MLIENLHYADVHVSEVLESHGIPDPYVWRFNNQGKLIPQHSDTPVEEIIYKGNSVAKAEFDAFLKIQERVVLQDLAFVVWISPCHPVYYPDTSKIIISENQGNTLLNRSINTSWSEAESIDIAKELAKLSGLDPEVFRFSIDVRRNPIFVNKETEPELKFLLEKILDRKTIQTIKNGEDFAAKEKFMESYLNNEKVSFGGSFLSCPIKMGGLTAFKIFSGEDQYGSLEFECPRCKQTNTREFGKLLSHCQHCGGDVRCG